MSEWYGEKQRYLALGRRKLWQFVNASLNKSPYLFHIVIECHTKKSHRCRFTTWTHENDTLDLWLVFLYLQSSQQFEPLLTSIPFQSSPSSSYQVIIIAIPFAFSVVLKVLHNSTVPLWSLKPNIIYTVTEKQESSHCTCLPAVSID